MKSLDNSQRQQDSLKRKWQEIMRRSQLQLVNGSSTTTTTPLPLISSGPFIGNPNHNNGFPAKLLDEDDVNVSKVVPAVTVVLEGRSICQRINLHEHESYRSLAMALRQMFVNVLDGGDRDHDGVNCHDNDLDLSNSVPGHIIAYEDMENDLLLAGDLSWKDFIRVARRIRILPVKPNSRRGGGSIA